MTPAITAIVFKFVLLTTILICIFWLPKVWRRLRNQPSHIKLERKRKANMRSLLSIVVGLIIFSIWMSIIGNPHVVETTIGVILSLAGGIYFHMQILTKIWPKKS